MKSYAIAITGGIGCGKSTVMRILEACSENTLYADNINRELLKDSEYISKIKKIFPKVIKNGAIDSKLLAETVFSDESALKALNDVAHPAIMNAIISKIAAEDIGLFVEMPLMNAEIAEFFDEIWRVDADENVRVARAAERDGRSAEEVLQIVEAQKVWDYSADYVIKNDGSFEKLELAVRDCLRKLKERMD